MDETKKIRLSIEKQTGKKTLINPFIRACSITIAILSTGLAITGCTPTEQKEVGITVKPDGNKEQVSDMSGDMNATGAKTWEQFDTETYQAQEVLAYLKQQYANYNKTLSDVDANEITALAKELDIFSIHANMEVNSAEENVISQNKEIINYANKIEKLTDRGTDEVKNQVKEEGIHSTLMQLSEAYKLCKEIQINVKSDKLKVGDTVQLNVSCLPKNAEVSYDYMSDNVAVLSVDNGTVVAKSESKEPVTVTVTDKNTGVVATQKFTVEAKSEVGVKQAETETETKQTEAKPTAKTDTKAETKQTDTKPAAKTETKTDTKPTVKTETKTDTKPTAKTETKTETKTTPTQSQQPAQQKVVATDFTLDRTSASLTAGQTLELNAYVYFSNNTRSYQGVQWKSSNTNVATVSNTGYVTAHAKGTATITASYGSFSKTCTFTVSQAQQSGGTQTQQSKPTTNTQQTKPSTNTQQTKPSTNTQQTNPSNNTQQTKPSNNTQQSKPSTNTQQTKPTTNTQQTKPSNNTQQSKPAQSQSSNRSVTYKGKTYTKDYFEKVTEERMLHPNPVKYTAEQDLNTAGCIFYLGWNPSEHKKVYSPGGYEMYECPEIVPVINKYRKAAGLKEVVWAKDKSLYAKSEYYYYNYWSDWERENEQRDHPEYFVNGKYSGEKYINSEENGEGTRGALEYVLTHDSLDHGNDYGGSEGMINGCVNGYNMESWVAGIKPYVGHWERLMDPRLDTVYCVYAPCDFSAFVMTIN